MEYKYPKSEEFKKIDIDTYEMNSKIPTLT